MNRMKGMAAGFALLAMSAVAQEPPSAGEMKVELERMLATSKMLATGPGVMGRTVKGAPYSGQEINENSQVLGDGTRIRNENRTMVFRDSEGRVRRETGDHVTIWDPVASVNYTLNTKNMTGVKSPMNALFTRAIMAAPGAPVAAGGFGVGGRAMRGTLAEPPANVSVKDGVATVTRDGKTETFPVGPDGSWQSPDGKLRGFSKTTVEGATGHIGVKEVEFLTAAGVPPTDHLVMVDKLKLEAADVGFAYSPGMRVRGVSPNFKDEELGEQVIEGVKARGTRQTSVIEAGAIGNDRPLSTVSERWTSDELQTEVMTRRSDPRTGEMTFRLVNISRGEQPAYLFQPPSGYNITEPSGYKITERK